jgi:flavin-dependent dehydrogenase
MEQGTEVLVVGGGPAGLAAAIAARKNGFQATVADGAKPPIDKACGEGLLPRTLEALRDLGVTIEPTEGRSFSGIRFLDDATSAEARFSRECGVGIRRTILHQKLVDAAEECGVQLLWNTRVSGISDGGVIVGDRILPAKWIIGADGLHSRVARWTGLGSAEQQTIRFAQRRHYRLKSWTDCVEVHWGRYCQAYVTPLAGDETCVVLISRQPRINFEKALREFPKLATGLQNAEVSSVQRGAVTAMSRRARVYRGNVALIGDASGSVDAITGEGLGLSFQQALALADALKQGTLENYQRAHRRIARRPNFMARLLLLLDRAAPLRRRVLRTLAKDPEVFGRLLEVNSGNASPGFLADTSARLGWRLLAA